jgi:predicted nucleic acid-binding protein
VKEFVLDASFALRWCFEDEATAKTESILTLLQDEEAIAWVPGISRYELLNALGKGISRERLSRSKALLLWQEVQALPFRPAEVTVDEKLLDLAMNHNLPVYDASYLALAQMRGLAVATVDGKLQRVAEAIGREVIKP